MADRGRRGFRAGRTAFRPVSLFDVSRQRAKSAAEADLPETLPRTSLDRRRLERLDRAGKMLLLAAREAWEQAGWEPTENSPMVLGTTAGGMMLGEDYFRRARTQSGSRRGQAFRAACYQPQVQARLVMEAMNFNGPISIVSNACASGANAIGQAWEMVRSGQADPKDPATYQWVFHRACIEFTYAAGLAKAGMRGDNGCYGTAPSPGSARSPPTQRRTS